MTENIHVYCDKSEWYRWKSTWRWLQIQMNWLLFASPLTCRSKFPVTRTVENYYKSKSKSKRITISNDNASNSTLKFLQPICVQILYLICAVSLWFPFLVSIHHYLLLHVETSLECIVTLTTNKSYCFLDPICAVHLEVKCQFVASVFVIHL